jgi:hypothetical protein
MDFTLSVYTALLNTLKSLDYTFQPFENFLQQPDSRTVVLRHDIDRLPQNALKMSWLENDSGVSAS